MKCKIYIKSVISYIGILSLFTFIHYFVDANLGTALLWSFIVLLVCSIVGGLISVYTIRVNISKDDIKAMKDEIVEFKVRLSSRIVLPLCFVHVIFKPQRYASTKDDTYYVNMISGLKANVHTIRYKMEVVGVDCIGVDHIYIRDFMGIFRYEKILKKSDIRVKTVPVFLERFYNQDVVKFKGCSADFDDSEEISDSLSTASGFPGYDHREYRDGDSLRRINHKLSAKKEKLFVRLDEPVANVRQAVLLDNISSGNRYKDARMIEGMIAYVGCLVRENICTEVYFSTEDRQIHLQLNAMKDISKFVELMGEAVFFEKEDKSRNIIIEKIERISGITVFSNSFYPKRLVAGKGVAYRIITCNMAVKGDEVCYIDKYLNIGEGGVYDVKD